MTPVIYTAARAAGDYRRHLIDILGLEPSTVRAATGAMNRFLNTQPSDLLARDFTADMFGAYQTTFQGLSEGTRNLQIGHLKRWLKYLASENKLGDDKDPGRKMIPTKNPKNRRRKAFVRKGGKLEALVEAARDWHERDAAYIEVFYWSGRRAGEVAAFKVGDFDLTPRPKMPFGGYSFCNIKTNSNRKTLAIPEPMVAPLEEWFATYAELIGRPLTDDDYLFPALKAGNAKVIPGVRMPMILLPRKRLPYSSAKDILTKAFKRAGIERAVGELTHALRRGRLDDLIHDGDAAGFRGIALAKTLADHRDERTTGIYTDNDREIGELGEAQAKIYGKPEVAAPEAETPAEAPETGSAAARAAAKWGVA